MRDALTSFYYKLWLHGSTVNSIIEKTGTNISEIFFRNTESLYLIYLVTIAP